MFEGSGNFASTAADSDGWMSSYCDMYKMICEKDTFCVYSDKIKIYAGFTTTGEGDFLAPAGTQGDETGVELELTWSSATTAAASILAASVMLSALV